VYTVVYRLVDIAVYSLYTNCRHFSRRVYTVCIQVVDRLVDIMASKVISTRLDESKVNELDDRASELGITRNELIAKVLLEFLGVDKSVDSVVDKSVDNLYTLVDNAVDNRIQTLLERVESLESAIANIKTSETTAPKKSKPLASIAA